MTDRWAHARGARFDEPFEQVEQSGGYGRALLRGSYLAVWCLSLWLAWLVTGFATRPFGRLHRRARFWFFRTWGRGTLWVLGLASEIRGPRPKRPALVVANHVSYLDVPLIASAIDCAFVAKAEIAHWPFAGTLASAMHTVFVERERNRDLVRVNALVAGALADGLSVVVFAEGQSTRGHGVLPFRTPIFATPARLGLPVTCATLHYARAAPHVEPADRVVSFYGDVSFREHLVQLLRAPGAYRARLTFDGQELFASDRKELAARAWERVAERFEALA